MDILSKLEIATNNLPRISELVAEDSGNYIEYAAGNGTLFGIGLYKSSEVAVQRAFMSKGASLEGHKHEVHEYLIVYRGKLAVRRGDKAYAVGVGQSIHFPPETPHSVVAVEDTWMLGITVPAVEGYPDAPK